MSEARDSSLSVLVLPSGEAGERLSKALDVWYRAGLLRPAAWIRPEDVLVAEGRAPEIRAVMRNGASESEGDLFTFLGTRRLAMVRVVMVQLLEGRSSCDAAQVERAMDVQFWVRESVPAPRIAANGAEVEGTDVRTVNLVTGVTGLSEMPREIVPRGWDVAAVTSPEDRPDPGRANAFVRAETNLQGAAVLSAAVVANLIPGTTAGPFDEIDGDASVVLGKALVIRSTVRALVGDTIVEKLAGTARSRALTQQSLGVIDPHKFAVGERDMIVEDLLGWLDEVDEGAAAPSSTTDLVDTSGRVMTVRKGVGVLLRFAAAAIGAMVSGLWRLIIRRTETAATHAIVGEGAGVDLVLVPGVGEALAHDLAQIEAADIQLRQDAVAAVERRPARIPTQELWGALRDVAHSAVDGGTFPEGAPRRLEGSRPVLLREIGDVLPSPADRFDIDPSSESSVGALAISACSPAEARDGARQIAQALTAAQGGVADAKQAVEAAGAPAEDEDARKARVASAKSDLATAETQLRGVTKVDRDFREWMERRSGALFWKFRERNSARLVDAARAEAQAKQTATLPSGLEANALTGLRRRFLWQSWAVVAVALCGGLWVFYTADDPADLIDELLMLLGFALIGLGVVIRVWYQGVLARLHKYEQSADRRARAAADFERHHGDRRRFEDVERGIELWSDVVGWSLHTPWLPDDESRDATDVREVMVSMPAAVQLGVPALDERDVATACRAAAGEVTTAGWRLRAYNRLVALFSDLPADADEVEAIAAVERLDAPHGREELRQFRDELAAGHLQRDAGTVVVDEIEGFLRRERLCLSTLNVRPVGMPPEVEHVDKDASFLAQALVPASPFAQETWSEQARVQGAHQEVMTQAWSRGGPVSLAPPGMAVSSLDEADLETSRLIDVVVRTDVSAWLDLTQLRLFGKAPIESDDGWTSGPDDSVFS